MYSNELQQSMRCEPEIPGLGTTSSIWFYLKHPLKAADKKRHTLKLLIESTKVFWRHLAVSHSTDTITTLKDLTEQVDKQAVQFETEYASYVYLCRYIEYVFGQWIGTEEHLNCGDFWDIKYSVIHHIEPGKLNDEFKKHNQACKEELERLRSIINKDKMDKSS